MNKGKQRFQIVPTTDAGGAGAARPPKPPTTSRPRRPRCPRYYSPEERKEWLNILNRLEERGLISTTPEGDIRALAVYQADFARLSEFLKAHGPTYTTERRPYQCPACHGSAIQPPVRTKGKDKPPEGARSTAEQKRSACYICRKRNREEIDAALLKGVPLRQLVEQIGTSLGALHRHKTQCLKVHPAKPVDRPCKGCRGTGVIPGGRATYQYPEVARRDVAAAMVAKLSAALGLDNVNLLRAGGRREQPKEPSALQRLVARRDERK